MTARVPGLAVGVLLVMSMLTACTNDGEPSIAAPVISPSPEASQVKAGHRERIAESDEFGLVTAVRRTGNTVQVDVDRVDMLSGAEGEAEAAKRGMDYSNDYFLVNDSHRLRSYRISPSAVVWGSIRMTRRVEENRVSLTRWLEYVQSSGALSTLFHFDVEDGAVVAIEEQYQP